MENYNYIGEREINEIQVKPKNNIETQIERNISDREIDEIQLKSDSSKPIEESVRESEMAAIIAEAEIRRQEKIKLMANIGYPEYGSEEIVHKKR